MWARRRVGARPQSDDARLSTALRTGLLLATVALCGAALAAAAPLAADDGYLAELTARADALGLAAAPEWQALLHYRPLRWRHGVSSRAQSATFFCAPDGKTNPRAELAATLAQFFAPPAAAGTEHPQCRFVARYDWLKTRLSFDAARLPEQLCPAFEEWRAAIAPAAMTLVFPEAYMNNPASMFGHTLLRIDMGVPGERKDLLAYAVNFAADTGPDGGVTFAWKGIFGYYVGFFSIRPYYEMVTAYGDWENRDIWEYGLSLSPRQIDVILRHLWELRGVPFFYYFFDENCSYELLSLLQVARPDLQLMDRFATPWVIPVDTVRVAAQEAGLVVDVHFRPSAATMLRHAARQLPAAQQQLALQLADGSRAPDDPEVAALSDTERAAVLGLAYDDLRHLYLAKQVTREESEGRARRLLVARSAVPVIGAETVPVPTPAVRPEEGHRTARVALGSGWRGDRPFIEARARPAFHDLLDPEGGYTRGAQIDFLDVGARLYLNDGEARLQHLTLVDIVSLSPRDLFLQPISWKINAGLQSRWLPRSGGGGTLVERHVGRINGGAGLTLEPWPRALAYGFVEATGDVGPQLQDDVALGPGLALGMFAGPASERWKAHCFARVTRFALGAQTTAAQYGVAQRLTLTPQTALELTVSGQHDFGHDWTEGGLDWNVYF